MNDIFKTVYILNLPEHTDRLQQIKQEMSKIGCHDYKVFIGIKVNNGQALRDRENGCKLSHMEIIKECKRNDIPYVCIFEDDALFADTFLEKLDKVKDFITSNNWDLFYLGGNFNKNHGVYFERVNEHFLKVTRCFTTHAYCVSRNVYDEIISWQPLNIPMDVLLTKIQMRGNSYCLNPRQVTQRAGKSYILNMWRDYDVVLRD
jgi:GR25 family glycosyltransferase involved in LPS biosynthesis